MMKAGLMDRRITIQRATYVTDEFNAEVPEWGDLATVWAHKMDIKDAERFASEVQAAITTRFQIRYEDIVADVNPKDRLIYEGFTYEIFGVKELGRRQGLEITAGARVD